MAGYGIRHVEYLHYFIGRQFRLTDDDDNTDADSSSTTTRHTCQHEKPRIAILNREYNPNRNSTRTMLWMPNTLPISRRTFLAIIPSPSKILWRTRLSGTSFLFSVRGYFDFTPWRTTDRNCLYECSLFARRGALSKGEQLLFLLVYVYGISVILILLPHSLRPRSLLLSQWHLIIHYY